MATMDQGVLPRALSLQTPGKINLTLRVLGRRDDGFHELESLVGGVGLFDRLELNVTDLSGVHTECNDPTISATENLAQRAAEALMRQVGSTSAGVHIELTKRIPLGAGLGGGSADAAAVLRICNELWNAGLTDSELADIGASIGSDVPVFFQLPSAVMRGRGDRVDRISLRWRGWVLLVTPSFSISTRDVYRMWQRQDSAADRPAVEDLSGVVRADDLSSHLFNELEPAVFRVKPELCDLKGTLERHIGGSMRVTGSGSTMFQLFDEYDRAVHAAGTIKQLIPGVATTVVEAPVALGDPEHQE